MNVGCGHDGLDCDGDNGSRGEILPGHPLAFLEDGVPYGADDSCRAGVAARGRRIGGYILKEGDLHA